MNFGQILLIIGVVLLIFLGGLTLGRLWQTKPATFRMFGLVIGIAVLAIFGLAFVKIRQFQAMGAKFANMGPPPEAVTTAKLESQRWPQSLRAVGTVQPIQGVTLAADLPGVVERIGFDSGALVKAGELLVQLDTRAEQAQLRSAEAKREMMGLSLKRAEDLLKTQSNSQSQLDSAQADFKVAEANVSEMRAMIERKTIRAPFSGVAGIRTVNVGQYLNSGAAIVPVESMDSVFVNFSLPQQSLNRLTPGTEVRVKSDATGSTAFSGKITAVNAKVDEATRNVLVQATVPNPDLKLRPGIFVSVEVVLPDTDEIVAAPASSVAYAPYGDSVFVVEELKGKDGKPYQGVTQKFVKLGATRGDLVALVSGVKSGEEVVTSGVFKLRANAAVKVNNDVQPGANPNPKPPNT